MIDGDYTVKLVKQLKGDLKYQYGISFKDYDVGKWGINLGVYDRTKEPVDLDNPLMILQIIYMMDTKSFNIILSMFKGEEIMFEKPFSDVTEYNIVVKELEDEIVKVILENR